MIEYKSGERLGYIKKSPHSPECVSSIFSSFNIDLPFLILRNIYLLCPFVKFNRDINIPIICYMGTFRLLHGDILSVAWGHFVCCMGTLNSF